MISWWVPFLLIGLVALVVIVIILIADYITPIKLQREIEKDYKKQNEKIDKIISDSRKSFEEFEKHCNEVWGKKE